MLASHLKLLLWICLSSAYSCTATTHSDEDASLGTGTCSMPGSKVSARQIYDITAPLDNDTVTWGSTKGELAFTHCTGRLEGPENNQLAHGI